MHMLVVPQDSLRRKKIVSTRGSKASETFHLLRGVSLLNLLCRMLSFLKLVVNKRFSPARQVQDTLSLFDYDLEKAEKFLTAYKTVRSSRSSAPL